MKSRCSCPSCNSVLEFNRAAVSTVKCPKCSHQGDVSEFKEIAMKSINCMRCKANLKVSETAAAKDIICPKCKNTISPQKEEGMATMIGAPKQKSTKRPGRLEMIEDEGCWQSLDKKVSLTLGVNTLGRKSPTSKSSVQLPTTDSYMSKNHAKIEVVTGASETLVHRLSNAGSANGTFHNEDRLEEGEMINLMKEDKIRLGRTVFKFVDA